MIIESMTFYDEKRDQYIAQWNSNQCASMSIDHGMGCAPTATIEITGDCTIYKVDDIPKIENDGDIIKETTNETPPDSLNQMVFSTKLSIRTGYGELEIPLERGLPEPKGNLQIYQSGFVFIIPPKCYVCETPRSYAEYDDKNITPYNYPKAIRIKLKDNADNISAWSFNPEGGKTQIKLSDDYSFYLTRFLLGGQFISVVYDTELNNNINTISNSFTEIGKSAEQCATSFKNLTTNIQNITKKYLNNNNIEKEDEDMATTNNLFKNFNFGKVSPNLVHMSMYGLAIKNKENTWVSYDKNTNQIVDVDVFNFDSEGLFYFMPVAVKNITVGDIISHMGVPVIVTNVPDINANDAQPTLNDIIVVDPTVGERKIILPTKSMFGFDYVTKIISVMDFSNGGFEANEDQPFGNILPWILMSGDNKSIDPLMAMMLMGGNNTSGFNPLMFALMANNDGDNSNLALAMMMMNQNK